MEQRLPSILLTAILIVLLVFALVDFSASSSTPQSAASAVDSAVLEGVLARLDRLELRVEELRSAGPASVTPVESPAVVASSVGVGEPDARRPVNEVVGQLEPIRAELARLWQAVAMRGAEVRPDARVDLDALRGSAPNYDAIKRYLEARNENYERARQELMLMGQAEVARRFGRPRSMGVGDAGARTWYYATQDDEDGFEITFLDGHVIDC